MLVSLDFFLCSSDCSPPNEEQECFRPLHSLLPKFGGWGIAPTSPSSDGPTDAVADAGHVPLNDAHDEEQECFCPLHSLTQNKLANDQFRVC